MMAPTGTAAPALDGAWQAGSEGGRPLTVAVLHNYYQLPGGEDEVFRAETQLLESHGHRVIRFTADNHQVERMGTLALAASSHWNQPRYRELRELFRSERPDIAHFHNTQPLISPAAYYAARAEGVSVVQSLHNFRLVCPNGLLFRDGRVCEDCLGKRFAWPGVVHACYRDSVPATAVTATTTTLHSLMGTWTKVVGAYIALSEFSRAKLIEGGLPADRTFMKPNFLSADPGVGAHEGGFGLYVGRLSKEKGLGVLQSAWQLLSQACPLKVIGGPLPERIPELGGVEWLGHQSKDRVFAEMRNAAFLVFPSECYENCPMTIIEAFACGLPVIVSDQGSAAGMVRDGVTGRHFRTGDPNDLSAKVRELLADPKALRMMGAAARRCYESDYGSERNYSRLMEIYHHARSVAHGQH